MFPLGDAQKDEPFGRHDYEIVFGRLEIAREVNVRSVLSRPLEVGEIYTFDRAEGLYDVVVAEITPSGRGGWSARCRVIDLQPI